MPHLSAGATGGERPPEIQPACLSGRWVTGFNGNHDAYTSAVPHRRRRRRRLSAGRSPLVFLESRRRLPHRRPAWRLRDTGFRPRGDGTAVSLADRAVRRREV
ncbi:hypothetical protein GCM10010274_62900 [Streptomyces lavendofoliae]|uniref:Uncharacterized protein n=1 Tax=Streptomyces lavendofoliae TaxID=67314 RepID=A0A918I3B9_9ACTN|nr:hypothetical protein GCM10010274_62900 [Streptomyces lavendofoliae]